VPARTRAAWVGGYEGGALSVGALAAWRFGSGRSVAASGPPHEREVFAGSPFNFSSRQGPEVLIEPELPNPPEG